MAVDVTSSPAADAQKVRRDREKLWRGYISRCDKCGAAANKLMYHEDGLQCFNCNYIIYMPEAATLAELFPDPEAILREVALREVVKQADPPPPAPLNQVEKPENWEKLGQRAKRAWYDDHKEDITSDYNSGMPREAVLEKWGMSASTLWLYSKRWGIESKRKKGPQPAADNKVERSLSPRGIEPPVLVITKKDMVNCSDAKFTKLWDIVGRIIRTRTSPYIKEENVEPIR